MLRSLMTAVSGVRAHQTMLDVTGNNISNANTTGFKKDLTIFQDLISQTTKNASGPGDGLGGVDPAQVGLGVQVAAIETIHTQGAPSFTGNPSDMMVQGSGFFVYDTGSGTYYSRAGDMVRDSESHVVQSGTGYKLQGYEMTADPTNPGSYVKDSNLSDVTIPLGRKLEPKATSVVKYQCNLDSRSKPYLPYGFPDLPYNANQIGWPGNTSGTAKVQLKVSKTDTKTYDMSFKTADGVLANSLSTGSALTTPPNTEKLPTGVDKADWRPGVNYFTYNLSAGGDTDLPLQFSMVGIGDDGKPQLELRGYGKTDANNAPEGQAFAVVNKTDLYDANNKAGTIAGIGNYIRLPGEKADGGACAFVDYDDNTGVVTLSQLVLGDLGSTGEIVNETTVSKGEVMFQYNIKENMNYGYFKTEPMNQVNPPLGEIKCLVEFDETPENSPNGSDLSKSQTKANIWFYESPLDPTDKSTARIGRGSATVNFDAAGNFESISDLKLPTNFSTPDATHGMLREITRDANGDIVTDDDGKSGNFDIITSTSGNGLTFRQNISMTGTPSMKELGAVTQGGFHQTKQTIYDCNGNAYTLEVNFKKITTDRWRWEAFLLDSEGKSVGVTCDDGTTTTSTASTVVPQPHTGEISFCGCGPIGYPLQNNTDSDITIPFSLLGMPNQTVKLDFSGDGDKLLGVTQYASETTTKAVYQDGYAMGVLKDYSVGQDGTITGNYTNDQRVPIYRVALATFPNEQGLEKVGDTCFRETINSGMANVDAAGVNGKGTIVSQYVEMSNVDLTEEFTHLIIAQRGFQANTRVITTSDSILEEVVNLKR